MKRYAIYSSAPSDRVQDDLGDYYLVEEVDAEIAALKMKIEEMKDEAQDKMRHILGID